MATKNIMVKGTLAPISEDQIVGPFSEVVKTAKKVNTGTNQYGHYVNISDRENGVSQILNFSGKVSRTLAAELEGITDLKVRKGIMLKRALECNVLEFPDMEPATETQPAYQRTHPVTKQPLFRYKLAIQGDGGFDIDEVESLVAAVPSDHQYTLATAMKFRA
jgi:hypothetical protein